MKTFNKIVTILICVSFFACKKDKDTQHPVDPPDEEKYATGWTGNDDISNVPTSISFGSIGGNSGLPSQVDLSPFLPPIGNQNPYGTCVAWATAYYTKTGSESIIHNYNQSQLSSPSYQLSPRYLFTAIPDNYKGGNCNGTDFIYALDVLQQKGVATLAMVPYYSSFDCSSSNLQANWDNDASNHKIKYYRKIDYSVESIKEQLANKFPVIIGARLTSDFENYHGGVLSHNYSSTILGSHALTIVGYDDSKNAFKIANSWGTSWGENGFAWLDYSYLLNDFVFNQNLYVVASDEGNDIPPPNPDNSGVDIASWVFADYSTYQQTGYVNSRNVSFNLYNIGSKSADASSNWSFYYLYYNAYNANDYGILFYDAFNTSIPANSFSCSQNGCNFNYNIASGSSFAETVFNQTSLYRSYYVPPLNGYYYLVLVADVNGAFNEQNEQNNIFYTTSQFPKLFQNGFSNLQAPKADTFRFENKLIASKNNLTKSEYNTSVNEKNKNAYTPKEIISFLKKQMNSGGFKQKIDSLDILNKNKPLKNYSK